MRIVITYQDRSDAKYLSLIDMAFQSAKRFGYETVLVGDIDAGDVKIKFPAGKEHHLMNWILAAQLEYIKSPLFDQDTVIFSPDALVIKPLDSIFKMGFDMAFTVRENSRWPINNGVIYLRPKLKQKIAAFWKDAIKVCKEYPKETQDWYGDQQSLHDVWSQGNHLRLGLNVMTLPCELYNASPRHTEDLDTNIIETAYIVHLKGQRKHLMQQYLDLICQS